MNDRAGSTDDERNTMTTAETTDLPTKGTITRWTMGNVGRDWATLYVDFGPFAAEVALTSREARAFAIDVLTDQGPYLGYQPPNEAMREDPTVHPFGHGRRGDSVPWRQRVSVRDCAEALQDLRDQYGDEALGWAIQRVLDA